MAMCFSDTMLFILEVREYYLTTQYAAFCNASRNWKLSSHHLIFSGVRLGADSQFSDFLDGLGPAQLVGRQTLATPAMGDIQIGMMDKKRQLEVEVIRARGLTSPLCTFAPYVKVYLLENGACIAKKKTKIARKTLDPLYQQSLLFDESPQGKVLQVVNDSVHGLITLHPLLVKIVDTPQFQRLRNIKQFGAGYRVYPGASHNRFEHSLGVCHLAKLLVTSLQMNQPELGITKEDVLCVQIAALCHDLGHGPFSHVFDGVFLKEYKEIPWKVHNSFSPFVQHEKGSCDMFDHMYKDNNLKDCFEEYGLEDEHLDFIKDMINVERLTDEEMGEKEKPFLYEIVSNKKTGIDVDKFDYFARICEALVLADPVLELSSSINDMEHYQTLTDNVYYEILFYKGEENDMKKAKEILQRIEKRQLYKMVTEVLLDQDGTTFKIDCGKGMEDPIKDAGFYNLENPNVAVQIDRNQVSRMLPATFCEEVLRVYYKGKDLDTAKKIVKEWQVDSLFPEMLLVSAVVPIAQSQIASTIHPITVSVPALSQESGSYHGSYSQETALVNCMAHSQAFPSCTQKGPI
ncbi:SAMH1 triphosphohydrolase, partial [Polypterus senegalus]|nr:SAMH1 triphosphohydrolase [Polypterus senegalus]